jgi:Glycosyl transferases group 1
MGEQLRSHIAACQRVHLPHSVVDIYRYASRTDPDHRRLVEPVEIETPAGGIRVFHVNGDEVESVLRAFAARGGRFDDGYNVIVPAWELPSYPAPWAEQLRRFDEVWALSHFLADSFAAAGLSSTHIGQAVEVPLNYFLPRKYFGIRESAFVVLHFFDLSSYATRKNPDAVLAMFEAFRKRREFADVQLVLKVKRGDVDGEEWLRPIHHRLPEVCCISKPMSAVETRSLINCCDCFVSLHRSEGFGRGTGEAMFLGRLALATGWSGNLDYMTLDNSLLVDHRLVPVGSTDYPFAEGQMWAEPDVDHAVALLDAAVADPAQTRAIAARGRRDIRLGHGYRAVGLRILERVTEIARSSADNVNRVDETGAVLSRDYSVPNDEQVYGQAEPRLVATGEPEPAATRPIQLTEIAESAADNVMPPHHAVSAPIFADFVPNETDAKKRSAKLELEATAESQSTAVRPTPQASRRLRSSVVIRTDVTKGALFGVPLMRLGDGRK